MDEVDVICYNSLVHYDSRKVALKFCLNNMNCSEGSEKDKYTGDSRL